MAKKSKIIREEGISLENEALKPATEEKVVSFDAWFFSKKLPKQHAKEIIWADFKARGAEPFETKEKYNEYLALYGVK